MQVADLDLNLDPDGAPIYTAALSYERGFLMRTCIVLLAATSLLVGGVARAQDSPFKAMAKNHYKLGTQYYETSNYKEALVEFQKAYKLQQVPGLLFNLARCHEVLMQYEQAISHYERYLKALPNAPKRAVVQARLQTLKKRLAEQQQAKKPVPAPVTPAPVAPAPPVPASQPAPGPEPVTDTPAEPKPAPAPRTWRSWAGWGAVGIGGASLITGVVLGVMAQGKADDYDALAGAKDPHYGTLADLDSDGQALQTGQIATLVAGGVLVAAGVGLVLWDRMGSGGAEQKGPAVVLLPAVGPGGGGISCSVEF